MSSIGDEQSASDTRESGVADGSDGSLTTYQERQAELEYRLLVLVDQLRARIAEVASALGLTPQQAMLLRHLGQPKTMGDIAVIMACDRSNVTGLVNRLAARGLVKRATDADDRRVKHLALTDEGHAYRARLQVELFAQSPTIDALAPAERLQLLRILRKVTPAPPETATG